MFLRHPILSVVTFAYLGLVGLVTLTPLSERSEGNLLLRLADFFDRYSATDWISFGFLEFWANVAMFVPIGLFFLLLLGRRRWWLAILLGVALTCGIEFAQQFIPNRVSDPRDLQSNSLGAAIGTLLALVLTAAKARRIRTARLKAS